MKFARAKGLGPGRVIGVHVLKNILIPIVTVIGLELGSVIAFAIITESIFAWPGTGKLLIDSINQLDRPVIVAYLHGDRDDLHRDQLRGRRALLACSTRACASARRGGPLSHGRRSPPKRRARRAAAAAVESPWRRFAAEFAESKLALVGLAMLLAIVVLAHRRAASSRRRTPTTSRSST